MNIRLAHSYPVLKPPGLLIPLAFFCLYTQRFTFSQTSRQPLIELCRLLCFALFRLLFPIASSNIDIAVLHALLYALLKKPLTINA